jgi:hypothetical protein
MSEKQRHANFFLALVFAALLTGSTPANALPQLTVSIASTSETSIVEQTHGRRFYRGYVYPYAYYYPPAYGRICPPFIYHPEYVRGVPLGCCSPNYRYYFK